MREFPPRKTALTEGAEAEEAPQTRAASLGLPSRYEDLGLLGSGGYGEVRRVWDVHLRRAVAMKILRTELCSEEIRARFLAEIELSARLSHPGIVAVHDAGELVDGRLWFTMAEVEGRTLRSVIDDVFHTADSAIDSRVSLRRLVDLLGRVCETVAYAHSRGVIHRDLKPENVMIGPFAQVLVMDWGIARKLGAAARDAPLGRSSPGEDQSLLTRVGDILGTPAYMAPEQALGEVTRHSPATDVYALGAILYHILFGKPPPSVLMLSRSGELLRFEGTGDLPPELISICQKAMATEPVDRYSDAGALSIEIGAFLDGAQRRERALFAFSAARVLFETLKAQRTRASACRESALRALVGVRPSDPVDAKTTAWALEDDADRLEREVALGEVQWLQAVQAALVMEPSLTEAHQALSDHYREQLVEAERARKAADVARFEVLVRVHDRGPNAGFLRGEGTLSLLTDPPSARVFAHRYEVSKRRLVLTPFADLGQTPLRAVPLPHGSYVLFLSAEGRREVRYPVLVERGEHWDGIAPGNTEPHPIVLPRENELDHDEVYVPAGYTWTGGDPQAGDSLPRRRTWIDAFVLRKYAYTTGELLDFLQTLVEEELENESLGLPATHPGVLAIAEAIPWIRREKSGRFVLQAPSVDVPVDASWPAHVDGHVAVAITRFQSLRTGRRFRLPDELEREKAARGVDGRLFPWGDQAEPTFACVLEVHKGKPTPRPVYEFPTDESPYGIRGLGGFTRDWCANVWRHEGSRVLGGRLELEEAKPEDDDFRAIRGGAWGSSITHSRSAARFGNRPSVLTPFVGVRLARAFTSR